MGKQLDEIDARARLALADARRAAVLVPQVARARSQTKWAETLGAFSARCETGESEGFWDWPETRELTRLLDERAS